MRVDLAALLLLLLPTAAVMAQQSPAQPLPSAPAAQAQVTGPPPQSDAPPAGSPQPQVPAPTQQTPESAPPQSPRGQTSSSQSSTESPEPPDLPWDEPPQPITIPAGTHLVLVLTHPVDSKATHRGDQIFAQTTAPVTADNQVAIPAGTFVQGVVEKLSRRGSRAEMTMQSLSIIFPNGYVANIPGRVTLESEEGTAWSNPSTGTKVGVFVAPSIGLGMGLLLGNAAHTTQTTNFAGMTTTTSTPKGMAIGSITGLAAGGVVSLLLLARSHPFYVEAGSSLEATLPQPVTLAQEQADEAPQPVAIQTAPVPSVRNQPSRPMPASTGTGTCYIPGSPGTPDTYIPGTPPIGDSPGTPGTFIPGKPPTPPTPYPCP